VVQPSQNGTGTPEPGSSRGRDPRLASAYGLATAAAASLWLVALHVIEGSHERNEPVFILHWLRDAGLALPITFLAAGLAIRLVAASDRAGGALRLPATVALTTSLGLAAGLPVHETLFAAEEAESISLPVHRPAWRPSRRHHRPQRVGRPRRLQPLPIGTYRLRISATGGGTSATAGPVPFRIATR